MKRKNIFRLPVLFLAAQVLLGAVACTKFTEIDPPKHQIVTEKIFEKESSARAAVAGIYVDFAMSAFAQGSVTQMAGLSADEIIRFNASEALIEIWENNLTVQNTEAAKIWNSAYKTMTQINTAIEGLTNTTTLSTAVKTELKAQVLFVRAFTYFYLTNFYGDVPLVTTSDWTNIPIKRDPAEAVSKQIIADLKASAGALTGTNKLKATRAAAEALLARVLLYNKDYEGALMYATNVIENPAYPAVLPPLDEVFRIFSTEAILQLPSVSPFNKSVNEASLFVPGTPSPWFTPPPIHYITPELAASFEENDLRETNWLGVMNYQNNNYTYPFKYKSINFNLSTEHYVVLRLAEQYLIRAEARAQTNDREGAAKDLNVVRERAGLDPLPLTLSKEELLLATEQERRVELFAEWGHRWLDLKRTNHAATVLQPLKPKWKAHSIWYPVPASELLLAPQLEQTDGYK